MTAKQYLEQLENIDNELASKFEMLNNLEIKAQAGIYIDTTVDDIINLKYKIKADINNDIKLMNKIYDMIVSINNRKHRKILFDKYVNLHSLKHIAEDMNYSYMQVCRYHGYALKEIEKMLLNVI